MTTNNWFVQPEGQKKLNRRERRAAMFGQVNELAKQQHAEGLASLGAREELAKKMEAYLKRHRVVKVEEGTGLIIIPKFDEQAYHINVLDYMIPYRELDKKYCGMIYTRGDSTFANDIPGYAAFVSDWFYRGAGSVRWVFKPNVVTIDLEGNKETVRKAFLRYVGYIMGSFDPAHEHKFAYVRYVLDMCCESVSWDPCR